MHGCPVICVSPVTSVCVLCCLEFMSSLGLQPCTLKVWTSAVYFFSRHVLSVTTAPSRRQYLKSGDTSDSWCAIAQRATCCGAPLESPVGGAVHGHGQQRLHMLVQMPLMLLRRSRASSCSPEWSLLATFVECVVMEGGELSAALQAEQPYPASGHRVRDLLPLHVGTVNCVLASLNC